MLENEYLKQVTQQAENQPNDPYTIKNELILFKGIIVIPRKLRESLLYEAHNTKIGGHLGIL